jgi:hypothetical protein
MIETVNNTDNSQPAFETRKPVLKVVGIGGAVAAMPLIE